MELLGRIIVSLFKSDVANYFFLNQTGNEEREFVNSPEIQNAIDQEFENYLSLEI